MSLPQHLRTGLRGEQLSARYLREKGYKILAANFRASFGETDIVAMSPDGILCFVEVKTRSPGQELPPAEAVDREKQKRLRNSAAAYISYTKMKECEFRFDIMEVILTGPDDASINHVENAF